MPQQFNAMITSEVEYRSAIKAMDAIIAHGTEIGDMELLSEAEKNEYIRLSSLVRSWEKEMYPFPIAANPLLAEIQIKMAEKNLKQKEMASILGIDESRMCEIMKGKRKISMSIAKRLRDRLSISADTILTFA